ncbi:maltose alpha-D-glucosyltransferase [Acidithrix ferrooxidans]|uniref:maltose alpha-D-glucosyltransferase n=1 Tax=Acidithrix ferrooxidans TaxID=1280514 RepID=A0A0D8HJE0_9ACTN|nr:maltose alpha-D-glucosyltransferase [Acidithrix ferrooxidans]KJF17867.1 trehalose synthase/amylase TreS [Acidithrix ferrooxidans]
MKEFNLKPNWFKNAIFYEVLVRGFFDSNSDGTGDIPGIIEKLDYLEWLGIDTLWLLPFYSSPLKDGGYDISDFMTVLPAYGNVSDVERLLEESHSRGIKVVADLVMNHTSDQHPWFIESSSNTTNAKSDFYVWSDDQEQYKDARIIFVDTERSNWTYNENRGQYYWHRFFSHQPDLNYDNPQVVNEMMQVLHFWLERGLDGFRLDAVPYLFEREGTNCENLVETHNLLKVIRKEVDSKYQNKVLLAEANQLPHEVVEYFGDGDECHMSFHFPIMPKMFMSIKKESSEPLRQAIVQTPPIPNGCQWGIFLRNHDELTLEMVTDEERTFMYQAYAADPRARRNVGIGRRLAPLIDNDRRTAELLHSLLLSMPGSPVLYYGDEILMGDNMYLGDRDSVRTPMQWSSDRNGGFSRSDYASLYLPVLMDPVYGYEALNVESQLLNPSSFLQWLRHMLWIRRGNPVFGTGDFESIENDNDAIFSFVRRDPETGTAILCVNNFARTAMPVSLDISAYEGNIARELLGGVVFPRITSVPYVLTLSAYGTFWFDISASGTSMRSQIEEQEVDQQENDLYGGA